MSFQEASRMLLSWPNGIRLEPFNDFLVERLRLTLHAMSNDDNPPGHSDIAALVRSILRRETEIHGHTAQLAIPIENPFPPRDIWMRHGCTVLDTAREGYQTLVANFWHPDWLPSSEPIFREVERSVKRRSSERPPADPAVNELFGVETYTSNGQRDVLRAAVLSPEGSVSIVNLPTGTGKSLVGQAVALLGGGRGVSIVIIPTIALAHDQVHQAKKVDSELNVDAWTSDLGKDERAIIRKRLMNCEQELLYCAPESLVGSLRPLLLEIAAKGNLRAFIVDEAHYVAQWGHGFRPEFQSMSGLWMKLYDSCPNGKRFRTLLMTATLTPDSYQSLVDFFGGRSPVQHMSAVHLRQEIDSYQAFCQDRIQQEERVFELLRHGPRPLILYLTRPAHANQWVELLRNEGYHRVGCIHGGTSSNRRQETIRLWRENQLDIMIAPSAFGVGMDKSDVRLVIHACVPENIDRYYQEVGRGGRDGYAASAALLWTAEDRRNADKLSKQSIITPERGHERWLRMFRDPSGRWDEKDPSIFFANLDARPSSIEWDSERNRQWNLKTLLLMSRAGVIEICETLPPRIDREDGESDLAFEKRREQAWCEYYQFVPVRTLRVDHLDFDFWNRQISYARRQTIQAGNRDWHLMQELLDEERMLSPILLDAYSIPEVGITVSTSGRSLSVIPPETLSNKIDPRLRRLCPIEQGNCLIVTYSRKAHSQSVLYDFIRQLVELGVRELAVSNTLHAQILNEDGSPHPLRKLHRYARERFLMLREFDEPILRFPHYWNVPRLSFLDLTDFQGSLKEDLINLERSLHIFLLPEDTPDPRHPYWKIGDAQNPRVVSLEQSLNILAL